MSDNPQQHQKSPGLRALLQSVLAAALGVQSSKNRERDFTNGKASHFIVAGIVFTFLFIATVATIVNLVTIQ
jgi:uncharacterized MAPEG superfamily protein